MGYICLRRGRLIQNGVLYKEEREQDLMDFHGKDEKHQSNFPWKRSYKQENPIRDGQTDGFPGKRCYPDLPKKKKSLLQLNSKE